MNLNNILDVLKLVFSGGVVTIFLGYLYSQKKIKEERDRLASELRKSKLKEDENEIVKRINDTSIDELIESSKAIASRINGSSDSK